MTLTRQDQDALERHAGYPHESAAVRMALAGLDSRQTEAMRQYLGYLDTLEEMARDRDQILNTKRAEFCRMLGVPVGPNVRERSAP